jgi:hypothetical protein
MTSNRQDRGDQQRAHLRSLVAPADRHATELSMARVTTAAEWWARQDRWGKAVTAPAQHILATVRTIRSSPGAGALRYELGRVVRNYSEFLVAELYQHGDGISPAISGRLHPAGVGSCPVCNLGADVTAGADGADGALSFRRLACRSCGATVTATHPADWYDFKDSRLTVSPGAVLGVDGVTTESVSAPVGGRRLLALRDLGLVEVR